MIVGIGLMQQGKLMSMALKGIVNNLLHTILGWYTQTEETVRERLIAREIATQSPLFEVLVVI